MEKGLTADKVKKASLEDGRENNFTGMRAGRQLMLALSQRADASSEVAARTRVWLILVILAVGSFYLATVRMGHEWGDDFAMYIHHAKNIAEGSDYRETGFIYNPSLAIMAPQTYPPVFPLLLVPLYHWLGMNMMAMKILVIILFLLGLYAMFLAFKNDLPWPYLIALIGVIGFNPYLWQFKDNIVSDLPFLFFIYLSPFLIDRAHRLTPAGGGQASNVLLISVSIYLAYGTRSIGIVLIPSLLLYDVIKHRKLTTFTIKIACLTTVFIVLQTIFLHSDAAYSDQLMPSVQSILGHLGSYTRALSDIWESGFGKVFRIVVFAAVSGLAFCGYLARVKKQISFFEVFFVLYLLSIIILPLEGGTRYLMPILPLYVFYTFLGVKAISRQEWIEGLIFAALIISITAVYTARYTRMDYGPLREGITKSETQQLFDYVKQKTDVNDVFIFRKPRALALFTGRRSSAWHQPQDDRDLWNYLGQIHANYLILGPKDFEVYDQQYLQRFIDKYRSRFEETYSNADFTVYRVNSYGIP